MYTPLDFMEQIKTCTGHEELDKVNIEFTETFFAEEEARKCFVANFSTRFLELGENPDFNKFKDLKGYAILRQTYMETLGLPPAFQGIARQCDTDYDFFTQLMQQYLYYDWRFHKLTYKVSNYLEKQLASMPFPTNALTSVFTCVPASTLYIDLSDTDQDFCNDLQGLFVTTSLVENYFSLVITGIIYGRHNRMMPIFLSTNTLFTGEEDDDKPIQFYTRGNQYRALVEFEDGITREVDVYAIQRFVSNFLVYLQASNKDIEPHQAVKANFDKPVTRDKEVKNKFRELRLNQVGYRLSTPLPKKKSDNVIEIGVKGSPKSAHYRSAHWHHFWTGSGDDKKLIIKWVEGVFVNGKAEAEVAVVHEIKKG